MIEEKDPTISANNMTAELDGNRDDAPSAERQAGKAVLHAMYEPSGTGNEFISSRLLDDDNGGAGHLLEAQTDVTLDKTKPEAGSEKPTLDAISEESVYH
jgi:hypothetical protein